MRKNAYVDPDINPDRENAKAVARVFYVNSDSRNLNAQFIDRQRMAGIRSLIRTILATDHDDVLSPGKMYQLKRDLEKRLGVDDMQAAVELLEQHDTLVDMLRDQALFCGGNHYGFEVFGGEAVRMHGEYGYVSEPSQRLQRFIEGMNSLNIQHQHTRADLLGVWIDFTRKNTDLFDAATEVNGSRAFYLHFSATANRRNGAGVNGEPLCATIAGEAWVWPDPLNMMESPPGFLTVGMNKIGAHDSTGEEFKYMSEYQRRVAIRTAHKHEHGRHPETGKPIVSDVLHFLPRGLPADMTAQNIFLLYERGRRKIAAFPRGPFFLGATRTSLMAVFAHTGYEVCQPTNLHDLADVLGIRFNDAYPEIQVLGEAQFIGACGTTYAVQGIGEMRFRGGRKVFTRDFFPKEQVDLYFRAVVGLEKVPGVEVTAFPLD